MTRYTNSQFAIKTNVPPNIIITKNFSIITEHSIQHLAPGVDAQIS